MTYFEGVKVPILHISSLAMPYVFKTNEQVIVALCMIPNYMLRIVLRAASFKFTNILLHNLFIFIDV